MSFKSSNAQALQLPRRITAESVEDLADQLVDGAVDLHLHNWERNLATSEARLTGLVARIRRTGTAPLRLGIHTGDAGDAGPGLRPDSRYWHTLTETLMGVVLVVHATEVVTQTDSAVGTELGARVRQVLRKHRGTLRPSAQLASSGGRFSAIAVDGAAPTPLPELFEQLRPDAAISFRRKLGEMIAEHCHVPALSAIGPVADFVREALENTEQHGSWPFDSEPRDTTRYLYARNYQPERHRAELSAAHRGAPIEGFLEAFLKTYGPRTPLIEVSVVDDGCGIAAQMRRGDLSIYEASLEEEAEIIAHALTREGTSKTDIDAGAGLDTALQACRDLSALFTLRTGRCFFSRDFLRDRTSPVSTVQQRCDRPLPLLGGTSISILLPWVEPGLFQ